MTTPDSFARRALRRMGVTTHSERVRRIELLLATAPPTDPARRRVEELLAIARARHDAISR